MDARHYRSSRPVNRRAGRKPSWRRYALWGLATLAALFVLGNAILWVVYRGKVLPNVSAAQLPEKIILMHKNTGAEFVAAAAGISVDNAATEERLKTQRSWFPLVDVIFGRNMPAVLDVQEQKFAAELNEIKPVFQKDPLPKRIVFQTDTFAIAEPEAGHRIDEVQFRQRVLDAFAHDHAEMQVPIVSTNSDASGVGLDEELVKLNNQLKTNITFNVNGQNKQLSPTEIGAWFVSANLPSAQTMVFSADKAKEYLSSLAAGVYNAGDGAAAASYALEKGQAIAFVLATDGAPVKYSYCVQGRGVGEADIPGFITKAAAVLGDPRGWNAGGSVAFQRTESGCDFTLWLSASSQMPSFGGVCDPVWSCRSGRNVVVNFDRWQGATSAWNMAGGSLEDYRVMVINHEVGHWLGFGHAACPGPGQPAPVMMQQSIDLRGCAFNPWPTQSEVSTLKQTKGVAALQPREEYVAESSCCCAHCVA